MKFARKSRENGVAKEDRLWQNRGSLCHWNFQQLGEASPLDREPLTQDRGQIA